MAHIVPKDELTVELCLFQTKYGSYIESKKGHDGIHSGYVCVSEPITVTFTPLDHDTILQRRVLLLDEQIKEVRATAQRKIDGLTEEKQRLLAITHDK